MTYGECLQEMDILIEDARQQAANAVQHFERLKKERIDLIVDHARGGAHVPHQVP